MLHFEPIWTGKPMEEIGDDPLYALDSYQELVESRSMRELMEIVLGGPFYQSRNTSIRYAAPTAEKFLMPPHQDNHPIRHTTEFRTEWIPVMRINQRVGGLAIAVRVTPPGSARARRAGRP